MNPIIGHPTLFLGILLAVIGVPAQASQQAYEGQILFSDFGIVAEFLPACDPASPFNGLDHYWLDIAGHGGDPFVLSTAATLDGLIEFFDADCAYRGGFNSKGFGAGEAGTVPEGSVFALVLGYHPPGRGAFTLSLG